DGSMRTVVCTQVLEHVPRPWDALAEFYRTLKEDGYLILSVPHLSAIHEAPNDYYRYTRYGLGYLLSSRGLTIVDAIESGGLVSFLAHNLSMVLMCIPGAVPGLRRIVWAVNYLLLIRLLEPVDKLLGFARHFPCNYVVVARKNGVAPRDGSTGAGYRATDDRQEVL
ncbi:MAG: methyltransferase domain-containing protein, partial [Phycisphaerae bacterium]